MEKKYHKSTSIALADFRRTQYFPIVLFIISFLVSIMLLVFFVIPQIQQWIRSNEEVEATKQRIIVLKNNVDFLQRLDQQKLEDDVLLASSALPIQKDYSGAMQSILTSAITSGVSLDTFSFTVGEIATKSAMKAIDPTPLSIDLEVAGTTKEITAFITSLYTLLPFSYVTTMEGDEFSGTKITLHFPSNPFPDIPFDKTTPIPQTDAASLKIIPTLTQWKENGEFSVATDTATQSGSLPSPF